MVKEYQGIKPNIDKTVFIAESADIIGKVNIEKMLIYGTTQL